MLDEAKQLSSTYKVKNAQLSTELSKTREEVRESVECAVSELQLSLKQANECIEDLKIKRQEAIDELSEAVEFNTSQKKQIDELQAEKKKRASDVEDSILESQCSLETIRRERAELRSKLSKREAELSGLKEMITKYKETSQAQLDKRLKLLQSLQTEKADVLFHCENLHIMRQEFLGLIMSIDLCDNFVNEIATKQSEGFKHGKSIHLENEILFWRDILQHVGGMLRALPRRKRDLSEAVDKIELLTNDMTLLKKSENDCKKILAEQRKQNEKLCSLLGQAEFEMERSALQIQEMSAALSHLQQNEAEMNEQIRVSEREYSSCSEQLVSLQKEVSNEREEIQKEKIELAETLKQKESQLVETTAEL
jgi:chromosome segregation ATPase